MLILEPIDHENSDHMTIEEFKSGVDCSCFTDMDGEGRYATKTEVSRIFVNIDSVMKDEYPKEFTHICWMNQ